MLEVTDFLASSYGGLPGIKLWRSETIFYESLTPTSRKHLRTKVTPDFHLTYSKNGGNLGSESK